MFARFDEEAQKVLLMAKKEMADLRHPYVGTEHLLLAILHNKFLNITKGKNVKVLIAGEKINLTNIQQIKN